MDVIVSCLIIGVIAAFAGAFLYSLWRIHKDIG